MVCACAPHAAIPPAMMPMILTSFMTFLDEIGRLNAFDAGGIHRRPRLGERALGVDAAAGVLDDQCLEPLGARGQRAPRNAKVGREAGKENALQAALLEIATETGRGFLIRLNERRIDFDLAPVAIRVVEFVMGV